MASVSRSRRATSGIVFLIAGALFVIAVILLFASVSFPIITVLAYAAVAVALAILGFGAVNSTLAKVLLIAAAVGWAILALSPYVTLPGVLITIAAIVAGLGGLVVAIVLYVGKEITNNDAIAFIVATALGLVYLLIVIGTLALGSTVLTLVALLFGLALIATGYLFRRTERGRRR